MKTPECKDCGLLRTSRKEREGFLQTTIFSGLGYYPWECNSCWKSFYSKLRGPRVRPGERRSKEQVTVESSGQ